MQTIEILERLVAFPTVSAASNLELIAYIEAVLQEAGFQCRCFADATGRKAACSDPVDTAQVGAHPAQ